MMRLFAEQHLPGLVLAIGLIIGLAGCSLLSDDLDGITLVNAMDEPLYARAVEKKWSERLYISYTIPTAKLPSTEGVLLQSRASVTLQQEDVMGAYNPDKTLRLFLYEVHGDTTYRTNFRDVTPDELEQNDFRIEVPDLPKN